MARQDYFGMQSGRATAASICGGVSIAAAGLEIFKRQLGSEIFVPKVAWPAVNKALEVATTDFGLTAISLGGITAAAYYGVRIYLEDRKARAHIRANDAAIAAMRGPR